VASRRGAPPKRSIDEHQAVHPVVQRLGREEIERAQGDEDNRYEADEEIAQVKPSSALEVESMR